jgi:hypothetical protein
MSKSEKGIFAPITTPFKEGWRAAGVVNSVVPKYNNKCPQLIEELARNGVTLEKWDELTFGKLSLKGIIYTCGGIFSTIANPRGISATKNK